MARIKDIVEQEHQRHDMASCRTIHLYAEGDFHHAYEWSAWLWLRFVKVYRISHTLYKDIEESVAMIGCPLERLQDLVPEGAKLLQAGEKYHTLLLPDSLLPADYSPELMQQEFLRWKQSLPEPVESNNRKKKKTSDAEAIPSSLPRLTDVMRSVIAFDVNKHSPFECMVFLSEIRQQLISMI